MVRTLNLVQGHPKLIELAEAQAADTKGLAGHLERAEGAWAAEGVGTGELASFFAAGESHVGADHFLRALAGWTDSVAATLPAAARTLFQVLCCCEDEDRNRPRRSRPCCPCSAGSRRRRRARTRNCPRQGCWPGHSWPPAAGTRPKPGCERSWRGPWNAGITDWFQAWPET